MLFMILFLVYNYVLLLLFYVLYVIVVILVFMVAFYAFEFVCLGGVAEWSEDGGGVLIWFERFIVMLLVLLLVILVVVVLVLIVVSFRSQECGGCAWKRRWPNGARRKWCCFCVVVCGCCDCVV